VEFGQTDLRVFSLFGFLALPYPTEPLLAFNQPELEPWWGAWSPPLLAIVTGLTVAGLLLSWALLATLYFLPAWLLGFFANRELGLGSSWRLAGAALMPGALLMSGAIVLYGLGVIDLIGLLVATAAHLLIGWGALPAAVLAVPRLPLAAPANPFVAK
jgi:hypothetical protein